MMTRQNFQDVQVGSSINDVENRVGSPYAIRKGPNGTQEYEYIERYYLNDEVVEENHYILVVKDGQVVSKRLNDKTPPAYDLIDDEDPNDTDLQ
jgi:hypothetical protein